MADHIFSVNIDLERNVLSNVRIHPVDQTQFQVLTNTLTSDQESMVVYHIDDKCLKVWNGVQWVSLCGQAPVPVTVINHEVRFTVGTPGFPQEGDTVLLLRDVEGTTIRNKKLDVYREHELLTPGDPSMGYTYDSDTGVLTFTPYLFNGERIIIKTFDPQQWELGTYTPPVGSSKIFSAAFSSAFV